MSAQQLADRTAELGMPIPRSVLANLESGRRATISAAEILILAFALDAAPIELLFPLGRTEMFEVLPGQPVPTNTAMEWFAGEIEFVPAGATFAVGNPPDLSSNIGLFRAHADAEREWLSSNRKVLQLVDGERRDEARLVMDRLEQIEKNLKQYRALIRDRRLYLPHLPPELRHIDDVDNKERKDG